MPKKWIVLLIAFIVEMGFLAASWLNWEELRSGGPVTILCVIALCLFNGGYLFPLVHAKYQKERSGSR